MRYIIIVWSLGIAAATLVSCTKNANPQQSAFIRDLRSMLSNKDTGRISLASISLPAWDIMYVVAPYTRVDELRRVFGPHADKIQTTGIESRDDVAVLVFTERSVVVGVVEVPRGVCDFTDIPSLKGIRRSDASFRIVQASGITKAQLAP